MDLIFEILIPAGTHIPGLTFSEPVFEWQGEKYPQGPPEADFGSNYKLVYSPVTDFVQRNLPVMSTSTDWQCISVKGAGLDIYGRKLWMNTPEYEEPEDPEEAHYTMRDLLQTMCAGNKWVVVIDTDEPFDVISSGSLTLVMTNLAGVIKGDIEEKGFLICGEGSNLVG
ncbi:hypothetical protein [Chitinophaga sp. S165]|uniref:hypothetical protein n=1 Tax=Chitinophaga sp. S165 TaxID=2135462 RepID=UPI000D710D30|nr:hypothetical protein [Chitinophaga sp. S165]PWV53978.1 hypothetical protein C7475_102731 [Chitinophaga sp. S165]